MLVQQAPPPVFSQEAWQELRQRGVKEIQQRVSGATAENYALVLESGERVEFSVSIMALRASHLMTVDVMKLAALRALDYHEGKIPLPSPLTTHVPKQVKHKPSVPPAPRRFVEEDRRLLDFEV